MVLITGHVLSVELKVKSMQRKKCSRRGYDFYVLNSSFFVFLRSFKLNLSAVFFVPCNMASSFSNPLAAVTISRSPKAEDSLAYHLAASDVVSVVSGAAFCSSPSLRQPLSEGASIAIEAPSVIVLVTELSLVSLSMPKG